MAVERGVFTTPRDSPLSAVNCRRDYLPFISVTIRLGPRKRPRAYAQGTAFIGGDRVASGSV